MTSTEPHTPSRRAARTRRLSRLSVPECFAQATLSAAVIALDKGKGRDARRLDRHVSKLLDRGEL